MLKHVHDLKNDLRERRDGGKDRLQRFFRPHFSGVKTQMQNWDLSLNNPILLKLLNIYLIIKIIQSQFYVKLTWTDRVQEGDIVNNINKMSALSGVR